MKRLLKKGFRQFVIKENGAVSIYAIIIILFVFLFNAVLIDFVRIMVAEYQTEVASKEAIRSAFSQYDKDVQNKGLFAISPDGKDPDNVFKKVFDENLAVGGNESYFQFVDTKMEEAELVPDETRTFANKNIVEHQILEDMKYKAPIEFGEMIVDSILPYTCAMRDATVVNDISEEVQDKAETRDGEIEDVIDHIKNVQNRFRDTNSIVKDPGSSDDYPIVKNLEDIRKQNEEYHDDDEDNPLYVTNSKSVIQDIKTDAKYAYEEMSKAEVALEEAREKNKKLGKAIDDAEKEAEENYEDLKTDQCSEAKTGDAEEELEKVQDELKQYYIDPDESDFFQTAKSKLSDAKYSINGDAHDTETLFPFVKYQLDDWDNMLDEENIEQVINIIQDRFDEAVSDVNDARKYVDENYEEMPSDGSGGSLDGAWEAMKQIKEILGKGKAIGKDFQAYNSLESLIGQYEGAIADEEAGLDLDDPQDSADGFFDKIMNIFSALTKMGENMRNEAYINEYILTRFSTDQNMSITNPANIPETFLLKNREVEYILYGQHVPGANYALALGELSGVRFALNFVSAFTKRKVQMIVLPLPKTLAAISWAFVTTVDDLRDITSKKKKDPPFLNITGVKTFRPDYTFYLRLFLFLHPDGDDQRIRRMQSLIDYNKDKSDESVLKDAPTYASATAESSVDLWFLPSLIEMFDKANVLEGKVKDGRYHMKKEVDYSY